MKTSERWTRKLPLNAILWVLVLGFLAYRMWPQLAAALAVGDGGYHAPAIELRTLDGESVSLDSLRGQVVLVNFWATWCPPCRIEMPGFERVYRERREDGFVVIGISTDRTGVGTVREFLESRGLTFPVAMASARVVRDYGGVRALPTSFLIDRHGRVRHEVRGYFAEPALRSAVERLLAEEPGAGPREGADE
jgi:peroxiredoxin